ncbi:MAG: hypothetical protein HYS38_00330 [Acidobacteria bacterium]|nr:hypothetical protein [Acidobacteriota bacterium]
MQFAIGKLPIEERGPSPCCWLVPQLNRELLVGERTYNTVRPHQALGDLTPQQFLLRAHNHQKCH